MPFSHGSAAKAHLSGYDITSFITGVSASLDVDTAEATVLGNTAKQYVAGLEDTTISIDGLFFGGTNELDAIVAAVRTAEQAGTKANLSYLPQGDTFGNRMMFAQGDLTSYSPETPVDDVAQAPLELQSSTGYESGIVLHVLQAEASGGNTTNVDNGALSSAGASAVLQVVSGSSLVVKVQHSVDNSAWVDLITFASASARGSQRVATAATATVNRHVRTLWTGTGTFAVGFSRK